LAQKINLKIYDGAFEKTKGRNEPHILVFSKNPPSQLVFLSENVVGDVEFNRF